MSQDIPHESSADGPQWSPGLFLNRRHTIALDAMGGDHGPQVVVSAALRFLAHRSAVDLILVGDQAQIETQLAGKAAVKLRDRLRIRHKIGRAHV